MKLQKWILLLVFVSTTAHAQPELTQSTRVVGQLLAPGREIEAAVMDFKDVLYACEPDGTNPGIVLQLRESNKDGTSLYARGMLVYLDIQKASIRWVRPIRYDEEHVQRLGDRLIVRSLYNSSAVNMQTGVDEWVSSVLPFQILSQPNVMLGYKSGSAPGLSGSKLFCVDMNTGKNLWSRPIGNNAGVNDYLQPDDSTLLVLASGLHQMHVYSGKGWDYEAKMVSTDYTRNILTSAVGLAFGVFTGTYVYRLGGDVLSEQCSHLLKEPSALYFASRDSVYKLSPAGKTIWKTSLGREAGTSVLWMDSTQLYFLNMGMAMYNGRQVDKGTVWLSAYDKLTGQPKYCNFTDTKDVPTRGYHIGEDTVDIFLPNRCVRYALNNGSILTASFDTVTSGAINSVVDSKRYYQSTEVGFQSLFRKNPTGYCVETTHNKLVMLDTRLQRSETLSFASLYTLKGTYGGYLFLQRADKTIIAGADGQLVAELNIGDDIFVVGNQLFGLNRRTLNRLQLDTILPISSKSVAL